MNINFDKGMKTLIIFVIASAILVTSQSTITTSLTSIISDFTVSSSTAQLTYSLFLLIMGVMIPLSAYFSRRFSVKHSLLGCVGVFIIGSVVSYLSPSIEVLIIGRIFQAIGAGLILPINQILLLKVLPEEKWQIGMGLIGLLLGITPALGPTIGGFITDAMGWRWIFLIFTILSIIIFVISLFIKYESEENLDYPLDIFSLITCIIAFMGIMLGFSNIADYGFSLIYVILPIIIGVICLILFVRRQKGLEYPLINLKVLTNKYFVWGTVFVSVLYFTMCGINILMPLFVQSVTLRSGTVSGLILLPGTLVMIVFNFVGPLLATKIGVRKVLIIASIFSIIGFGFMVTYNLDTSVNFMIVTQLIRCVGAGLGLTPAITWAMSMVSDDVEDATAVNNTSRQVVGAIGSAIVVVIMSLFAGGEIAHNIEAVSAFSLTSILMLILTVILLIIVILFIKNKEGIEKS